MSAPTLDRSTRQLLLDLRDLVSVMAAAVVTHDTVYRPLLSRIDIALGKQSSPTPQRGGQEER